MGHESMTVYASFPLYHPVLDEIKFLSTLGWYEPSVQMQDQSWSLGRCRLHSEIEVPPCLGPRKLTIPLPLRLGVSACSRYYNHEHGIDCSLSLFLQHDAVSTVFR